MTGNRLAFRAVMLSAVLAFSLVGLVSGEFEFWQDPAHDVDVTRGQSPVEVFDSDPELVVTH
ncbi:hypothetical protein EXE49_09305 [Halorubrum sp. ASP121]|uniref:hypothetical protein n=1 Tax=Halorubrum sp. ASP121 TaxID=1855858 RepID=UPI0010F7C5CC|nr:hypothetical protein [Halorubrum sp. ASP121]TKX49979.1 hypothetical protein EXE49_09305 [Halorubrum sp. ASP121]